MFANKGWVFRESGQPSMRVDRGVSWKSYTKDISINTFSWMSPDYLAGLSIYIVYMVYSLSLSLWVPIIFALLFFWCKVYCHSLFEFFWGEICIEIDTCFCHHKQGDEAHICHLIMHVFCCMEHGNANKIMLIQILISITHILFWNKVFLWYSSRKLHFNKSLVFTYFLKPAKLIPFFFFFFTIFTFYLGKTIMLNKIM